MRRFQFLLATALAVAACLALANRVDANWGRYGRCYGGYGGYGGYGYGRYYGYYPGYYGYSAAYYPRYSGYYPAYGYAYYPAYTYAPAYYVPAAVTYPAVPAVAPTVVRSSAPTTSQSLYYSPPAQDNTARVRVLVPPDAQVWVDGYATTQTGDSRSFNSPALDPNQTYTYEVKARWMKAGAPVEQTRRITVRANQTTTVDFGPVAERAK